MPAKVDLYLHALTTTTRTQVQLNWYLNPGTSDRLTLQVIYQPNIAPYRHAHVITH